MVSLNTGFGAPAEGLVVFERGAWWRLNSEIRTGARSSGRAQAQSPPSRIHLFGQALEVQLEQPVEHGYEPSRPGRSGWDESALGALVMLDSGIHLWSELMWRKLVDAGL